MEDTNREDIFMEKLSKELRLTRILCSLVSVLLVCVLLGGVLIYGKIRVFTEQMKPLAESLANVDYEVLNETMSNLNTSLEEIDLTALSEQLSQVDWEALSTTLKNLNEAAEALKGFGDSFKGLFGKIGIGNKE